jgi:hypothetical protein
MSLDLVHPPVMVKSSVLHDKLRHAIGEGVDIAMILTTSGSLLCATSGRGTNFGHSQECRMLAALVANVWRTYASVQKGASRSSQPAPASSSSQPAGAAAAAASSSQIKERATAPSLENSENSELDFVIAELETNKLCAFGMGGRAVLALFASNSTELGLLKLKAASLQGELFSGISLALRQDTVDKPGSF